MMFHDTDESRIKRNTNDLAFPTPNQPDFVEMVWKNNSPVMQKSHRPASSSGFSDFFDNITRFDSENVNPRAVPESHNIYGLLPATTTGNTIKHSTNKRSSEERDQEAIQIVENNSKKLKTDHQFIITPQGDSLVPDNTPVSGSMEHHMMRRKTIEFNDHIVPGPDMSIAASNDAPPPCTSHTNIYQDSDSSTYLDTQQWSDEDEDQESARRRRNDRRNRSSLIHTRSEKKRRDRINKKMRALQVLLPNTNKVVDKASVLDEAIDYVKSLQLQLQLMSSGTHMFPVMMPQIQMNQFSAAAATAMCLGMAPHQFPVSPMHHGFPQMLSCFPYMHFFGGPSSAMAVPVVQAETTSVDQIGSNPPPMSGSNHLSYPNDFSQMGFESEARQQ